jgi:hypothetical protein
MTLANAIKKMGKLGEVKQSGQQIWVQVGQFILSTMRSGSESSTVGRFHTRRISDQPDSMTDYFPGSYWSSFKAAVEYGLR